MSEDATLIEEEGGHKLRYEESSKIWKRQGKQFSPYSLWIP
jgi:hypothetical protein